MRIAFYIPNRGIKDIDCSHVIDGNPGIGGSEYSAILIAEQLTKKSSCEIFVLCEEPMSFPTCIKYIPSGDIYEAAKYCLHNKVDYFIVDGKFLNYDLTTAFYNLNFIAWCNTFIPEKDYTYFAQTLNITSIINVGKEQHLLLKHTPVYSKSTYIYNAVTQHLLSGYTDVLLPNSKRAHNVVYIGSLHRAKGFHLLAKAWRAILKSVPDANLYVIGGGKLYNRNSNLGKLNIAEKSYEDEFVPYITDENGEMLPSVHFMGVLGNEKKDILAKCKVGVPNPSGVSETFGFTAVEMAMFGCRITTIKCPGYIDTVAEKSNLYDTPEQLPAYVVRLLKEDVDTYAYNMDYFKRFSLDAVTQNWIDFFEDCKNGNDGTKQREHPSFAKFYKSKVALFFKSKKNRIKRLLKHILSALK